MRTAKRWLIAGVVVVVLGALPLLAGLPRVLVIAAGALVVLIAVGRLLSDESDYSKEPPVPPGGVSGW
jgi:hypothetical protein